jgi:hypothetical protein
MKDIPHVLRQLRSEILRVIFYFGYLSSGHYMSTAAVLLDTETKILTQNGALVHYINYLKKEYTLSSTYDRPHLRPQKNTSTQEHDPDMYCTV